MAGPILHVIPFLWSGAGAVVTRLCEAQRARGPVTLVTTGTSNGMSDWPAYRRRLRRAGVTHHRIDFFHRDAETFWSGIDRLATLLRQVRPSVVHAHAGVPAAAAAIARAIAGPGARVIGQMYSWGPNRPDWMRVQDMWGFSQADCVVCSARAYWNLLVGHGVPTRRLVYLPWGLPLEELPFRDARAHGVTGRRGRNGAAGRPRRTAGATGQQPAADRRSAPAPAGGPVLGFVGRIEPRKGQAELVEVLARVRRRLPDARLELVGPVADAGYAAALRTAIHAHRLEAAVTLHDRVPSVLEFLERWDVFVSLSSDEGQGLAVLEAMAVGVPVVARPVAGIEDFLAHERTGVAITGSGASSAASAIVRASQDRDLRARVIAGARRRVERQYSWQEMLTAFDRIYTPPAGRSPRSKPRA